MVPMVVPTDGDNDGEDEDKGEKDDDGSAGGDEWVVLNTGVEVASVGNE